MSFQKTWSPGRKQIEDRTDKALFDVLHGKRRTADRGLIYAVIVGKIDPDEAIFDDTGRSHAKGYGPRDGKFYYGLTPSELVAEVSRWSRWFKPEEIIEGKIGSLRKVLFK